MNRIIDSNVLFSALIKNSTTRKIILEYDGLFLFPSFVFEEMRKHISELLQKSAMSTEDFNRLLKLILTKVKVVPAEMLRPHRDKALQIVKEIDHDDMLFIACALAYPESVIWSNDKKLKKQDKIKVLNTAEVIELQQEKQA